IQSIVVAPGFTEFTISGPITGCTINGQTVNPVFSVCEVPITFSPKYPGFRSAPLVVTDSTGTVYTLGLTGTGLGPQAALTPGIINEFAGGGTGAACTAGPANRANLVNASSVSADDAGNVYIADSGGYEFYPVAGGNSNGCILKVDTSGNVTVVSSKS